METANEHVPMSISIAKEVKKEIAELSRKSGIKPASLVRSWIYKAVEEAKAN